MKQLTLRAQLNGFLYQAERRVVNNVIAQVQNPQQRDDLRVMLIAKAVLRNQAKVNPQNRYLQILFNGLLPYLEMSLMKAKDINYNLAMPADMPTADDND